MPFIFTRIGDNVSWAWCLFQIDTKKLFCFLWNYKVVVGQIFVPEISLEGKKKWEQRNGDQTHSVIPDKDGIQEDTNPDCKWASVTLVEAFVLVQCSQRGFSPAEQTLFSQSLPDFDGTIIVRKEDSNAIAWGTHRMGWTRAMHCRRSSRERGSTQLFVSSSSSLTVASREWTKNGSTFPCPDNQVLHWNKQRDEHLP